MAPHRGDRACPYQGMEVWDSNGTGRITFSAAELGTPWLGHIVENRIILSALLERLAKTRVHRLAHTPVTDYHCHTGSNGQPEAQLTLEDGSLLCSRLVIAADGARSRTRSWAGIPMREWDYKHHAITTTVELEQPHQHRVASLFGYRPAGVSAFAGQCRWPPFLLHRLVADTRTGPAADDC